MPVIWDLLKLGRGKGSCLYPFEKSAVDEVAARLGQLGPQLRKQIECVNKVQRLIRGKEVNLYCIKNGKPAFPNELRFLDLDGEALLATVYLKESLDDKGVLNLELWLANGRLFSLIYDRPPQDFFPGRSLHDFQPAIADITIGLEPGSAGARVSPETAILSGRIENARDEGRLTEIQRPLTEQRREAALSRISAQLPSDYVEFVTRTNGARFGEWVVHGPENIRKIVSDESNYYVLAESVTGFALVMKEEPDDGTLYLVNFEDGAMHDVGRSFQDAAKRLFIPRRA